MTTDNPAHKARIKITDRDGNVSYLHYQNGWICHLANGQAASLTYAGISDKQVQACKFALNECTHPNLVLAAVKRYAAPSCTYELVAPEVGEQGPPGHYRAVDAAGNLVWKPCIVLQDAPLAERLRAVCQEARAAGYAIAVFNPDELIGIDNEELEQRLVMEGNTFIDETREPDEEEE